MYRLATPRNASSTFESRPQRTFFWLSVPVFVSLVAEPITGLVDTAFVKELGAAPLAALGVGTVVLSSLFWVFNFLAIGTQTEVARTFGAGRLPRARSLASLAGLLCLAFGTATAVLLWVLGDHITTWMAATGEVHRDALTYIDVRACGAPAVLVMAGCFGVLRGLQDMRSPLWIAVGSNLLNVLLDYCLIFGVGPIPAMGVAGAAWATVIAQWSAAFAAVCLVQRRLGWGRELQLGDARVLLVVGFDLFFRTGLLTLFILLTTRAATSISADAGAAHQAIRNVWMFTALALDAFAASAQSLIGYFRGAGRLDLMRRVAAVACQQAFVTGVLLLLAMLASTDLVSAALVPASASSAFVAAWWLAAVFQPLNAISFATDGVHWGTADYRFLRNAMVVATLVGAAALACIEPDGDGSLAGVWLVTGLWICTRAVFGIGRIWPGSGPWR